MITTNEVFCLILGALHLTISAIVVSLYKKKSFLLKYLGNIPGPKPHIIFGNTLDLIGPTERLITTFTKYTKKYGDTFVVHDGPLSVVLATRDNNLLETVLTSPAFITKADQYEFLNGWLGTGLLTSTGKKWQDRRKMLTPAFHFSILKDYVDIFESVSDILIMKLNSKCDKPSVNIAPMISLYTLDVICDAAMGISINAQTSNTNCQYINGIRTLLRIVMDRMISPIHPFLYPFTPNYYAEKKAIKIVHSFVASVIDGRIKSLKSKDSPESDLKKVSDNAFGVKKKLAFLDLLLQYNIDGKSLSREDILEEVNTFMFEGHDTTASAINFTLYSLAINPDIQKKVFEEQNELFRTEDSHHVKTTYNDLQKMEYLNMVIKEVLRLYPSVPFYGRTLQYDLVHEGVVYPRGLTLLLLTFLVHRNEKHFPDPEKFDPERFRDGNFSKNIFSYLPFSAGPRNCIGQKFAMLEIKSTVSKVVRNFELLPSKSAYPLQLSPTLILVSESGIHISLKRRKQK